MGLFEGNRRLLNNPHRSQMIQSFTDQIEGSH
jgi:hypothetical protein